MAMAKSGFQPHQIAAVTKHQSLESLKHYIEKPTIEDCAVFSNALSNYGAKKKSNSHPAQWAICPPATEPEDTLPDIPSSPQQQPVIWKKMELSPVTQSRHLSLLLHRISPRCTKQE